LGKISKLNEDRAGKIREKVSNWLNYVESTKDVRKDQKLISKNGFRNLRLPRRLNILRRDIKPMKSQRLLGFM
jgi:hypothetical protein